MIRYFKNIFTTIWTVVVGMRITLSYLLSKPVTMQYPDEKEKKAWKKNLYTRLAPPSLITGWQLPERFRGLLKVDLEKCIACELCAKACPVEVITIETEKVEKKKKATGFSLDISRCIFCGLCTEACPRDAISHSREYELACHSRSQMIHRIGRVSV